VIKIFIVFFPLKLRRTARWDTVRAGFLALIFARAIHGADARASVESTCRIAIAADRPRLGDSTYGERGETADHMVSFAGCQLFCALAGQYSFVIVHVLFLSYQPLLKLAYRVTVVGPGFGTRGTDRQSVDAAGNVVNFRRGQLACVLATQYSIIFVHGPFLSFLVSLYLKLAHRVTVFG
jgi:hypothetical protein